MPRSKRSATAAGKKNPDDGNGDITTGTNSNNKNDETERTDTAFTSGSTTRDNRHAAGSTSNSRRTANTNNNNATNSSSHKKRKFKALQQQEEPSQFRAPPPAAFAAASNEDSKIDHGVRLSVAAADPNNDHPQEPDGILAVLVEMLRQGTGRDGQHQLDHLADEEDHNYDFDDEEDGDHQSRYDIDVNKAQNVLEAAAGNLALAAQLFWDDYFVTEHHNNQKKNYGPAAADDDDDDAAAAGGGAHGHAAGGVAAAAAALREEDQKPASRKNQKAKAGRAAGAPPDGERDSNKGGLSLEEVALGFGPPGLGHDDDEDKDDDEIKPDAAKSSANDDRKRRRRKLRRSLGDDFENVAMKSEMVATKKKKKTNVKDEKEEEDDDDVPVDEARPDEQPSAGGLPAAGLARRHRGNGDNANNNGAAAMDIVMDQPGESDILISDDEVGGGRHMRAASRRRLSGNKRLNDDSAAAAARSEKIKKAAEAVARAVLAKHKNDDQERHKRRQQKEQDFDDPFDYISDYDWLEEDPDQEATGTLWSNSADQTLSTSSTSSDENDDKRRGIPRTWLSVGFNLSDCCTGLVVKPPDLEAIENMVWTMNRDSERRLQWPPPYHCKSVTAILSIVTAMLYSGASIQGNEVNCSSGKKPWADLTEEDRKREFDGRLADALSSLIFIAAKASARRKKKSYLKTKEANKKKGDKMTIEDINHERRMQSRLLVIPTCAWREQAESALAPRCPGDSLFQSVEVTTSLTNINDIKAYVLSTMRSFTAPGGVALFMETLLRVQGNSVVTRQVAIARRKLFPTTATGRIEKMFSGLVRCTCDERQHALNGDKPLPASVRNDVIKLMDMTPPGTECTSIELLTLLLTGRVQTSWKDCFPVGLGFGLLTDKIGEVSQVLSRPEKPVWVLRGETSYSVLWMKDVAGNDDIDFKTVAKLDKPGTTLELAHWNPWYGLWHRKSEFRLITACTNWEPPSSLSKLSAWDQKQSSSSSRMLTNTRRHHVINVVSADEHEANETKEKKSQISRKELDRLRANPDDEKLYPNKYRLWRYDLGDSEELLNATEDSKSGAASWTPYFRLTARQKKIVEIKHGPKINSILWTRWPDAKIDNFLPKNEPWPIV